MIKEFRDFALRGNLLELAVAFVLGVSFAAVMTSLVEVLQTFVAGLVGKDSFDLLEFNIGDGIIHYGIFLTELANFLVIAFVLFLVVKGANRLAPQRASTSDCPHCLTSIPIAARACAACGRDVQPAPA